jgi:hypothetical protein
LSDEEEGDLGFDYTAVKNGTVLIRHKDKLATTLRGSKAGAFMKKMDLLDFNEQQQWMARVTGNYKHGNERLSKRHVKNQH